MFKKNLLLIVILLLGLGIRVFALDKVPPAMTHDELGYVYNAYSIALSGRDVNGIFFPWNFDTGDPKSPIPVYLLAPIVGFFGINMITARILFSILGTLDILFIYLIAKKILGQKRLALISAAFIAIMPWHIQLSRIAYDGNVSLFFYLLGLVLLLYSRKKTLLITFSSFCFFLGFFSYHGAKVLFIPLLLVITWYLSTLWNDRKQAIKFGLITAFITLTVFFVSYLNSNISSRYREVTIFDNQAASEIVNFERRTSYASPILKKVFNNKLSYYFSKFKQHYLEVFSSEFLFTKGEASPIYSLWNRGQMHVIDVIFLLVGIVVIGKRLKRTDKFLILMALISPLPAAIAEPSSISLRAIFLILPLSMIAALGIDFFINSGFFSAKKCLFFLSAIYFLFLSSYLYQYFFRYPIYAFHNLSGDEKVLVELTQDLSSDFEYLVIGASDANIIWEFAFYNKITPSDFKLIWKMREKQVELDTAILYFDLESFKEDIRWDNLKNKMLILDNNFFTRLAADQPLPLFTKHQFEIRDPKDAGAIWRGFVDPQKLDKISDSCSLCYILP